MIVEIFAIRDSKARAFSAPFFIQNEAMAVRSTKIQVQNDDSYLSACSEDYALYRLGSFDDETGILTSCEPVMIVQCLNLKEK